MARTRTLETKAQEMILHKLSESGEMETEEIMDLIRPHFLFDPLTAKERQIRRKANQLAARIRDEKGIRSVFNCNMDGVSKYVNIDESQDVRALRGVETQLAEKLNGLEISRAKASKRREETEEQVNLQFRAEGGS